MPFEMEMENETQVNIKVVGVGGGGSNTVNRMVTSGIKGVEFIVMNTDKQSLNRSSANRKVIIGERVTRGFGAGANPEVGKRAAEESLEDITEALKGADMVFLTSGMGGGTGTGASPIIAKAAKDMGILTVGIVTKPFAFEGKRRMEQAEEGIKNLSQYVDSLVVIPNERLKMVSETRITLVNAFEVADGVLSRGVQSISDLINGCGFVNLDFADVTAVMANAGLAHMGVGFGKGKEKAEVAARMAISSPLLETSIAGARGIIVSITASPDIGFDEAEIASSMIQSEGHPDVNLIWGVSFDESLQDLVDRKTFKLSSTPEQLFVLWRQEDVRRFTDELPLERLCFVGTDMYTKYFKDMVDSLDDAEFEQYLNYHFSICERADMVGMSHHTLDILRKEG